MLQRVMIRTAPMKRMTKIQPNLHHLHQPLHAKEKQTGTKNTHSSFKDVLTNVQHLKVSKHATQRLNERNITIDKAEWEAISDKMNEAKKKGITDSLVITDQATLVVSTKNHTVVTAMERSEAASKIFTNINGTILMD